MIRLAVSRVDEWLKGAPSPTDGFSRSQLQRYESFANPNRRDQFAAAHGLLNGLLRSADLQFSVIAQAEQPPIVETSDAEKWYASVSHSGEWAVAALDRAFRVGVDIEDMGRRRPVDRLIEAVCCTRELHQMKGLTETGRSERFYQLWTLKEACLKATHGALSVHNLKALCLDEAPAEHAQGRALARSSFTLAVWSEITHRPCGISFPSGTEQTVISGGTGGEAAEPEWTFWRHAG